MLGAELSFRGVRNKERCNEGKVGRIIGLIETEFQGGEEERTMQ